MAYYAGYRMFRSGRPPLAKPPEIAKTDFRPRPHQNWSRFLICVRCPSQFYRLSAPIPAPAISSSSGLTQNHSKAAVPLPTQLPPQGYGAACFSSTAMMRSSCSPIFSTECGTRGADHSASPGAGWRSHVRESTITLPPASRRRKLLQLIT